MDTAIIGAVSALAGVALAQAAAMLRAKLEELADQLHRVDHWMDLWFAHVSPESSPAAPRPLPVSDEARRVHVLALLYFPALRHDAAEILHATNSFYLAAENKNTDRQALIALSRSFAEARKRIDEAIARQATQLP